MLTDNLGPDPMLWKAIWPRPTPSGYPLSKQAIEWVKTRMEECSNDHICHSSELFPLPDRILSFKASLEGKITICVTEPKENLGKYATLSHRWGLNHNFVTTIANLSDRKKEYRGTSFPKRSRMLFNSAWSSIYPTSGLTHFALFKTIQGIGRYNPQRWLTFTIFRVSRWLQLGLIATRLGASQAIQLNI